MGIVEDFFGSGNKFFLRDFRNASHLRPDVNPPRQQHQGYVNFILNRDLFGFLFGEPDRNEFRTQISSMVRTADLPSVEFQTETKNAFNRKKIVNTGVRYNPVNMTVFDTVGNEWLTTLMKYFAYHYMDPRNKVNQSGTAGRDIESIQGRQGGRETVNSGFGDTGANAWDSNLAGYNPNISANFFERVDYVLFHGNKGVQYSIINPVITEFKPGSIDYASSNFLEFSVTMEYERFTVFHDLNFALSDEDVDRFEDASNENITGPAFTPATLPAVMGETSVTTIDEDGNATTSDPAPRRIEALGTADQPRGRSSQMSLLNNEPADGRETGATTQTLDAEGNVVETSTGNTETGNENVDDEAVATSTQSDFPDTYGPAAVFSSEATDNGGNWFTDVLSDTAEAALGAALGGGGVKDVALGTLVGGLTTKAGQAIRERRQQVKSSAPNKGNTE